MAVTFDQVVQRVKQQLLGYTRDQASISYLTASMTATDVDFTVDPETVKNLSRGLVEIGDEMILIKKFDRTTGLCTVFGGLSGRGAEGTTAAIHSENDLVTSDPRYPKIRIKEAINDAINGVYPDLWVFGTHEFAFNASRYEYPIPAEAEGVHRVTFNTIGPSGYWQPLPSWRFNSQASTTAGQVKPTPTPTGKTLQIIRDTPVPGRNVRVIYTKKPNLLVNDADTFEVTTGLPERCVDLIVYGACWRLLPGYEAGRLQQSSIESTERAPLVPTGAATNASKYYYGLYQARLDEERDRLFSLHENYQTFSS